jgi:hypothetical protein
LRDDEEVEVEDDELLGLAVCKGAGGGGGGGGGFIEESEGEEEELVRGRLTGRVSFDTLLLLVSVVVLVVVVGGVEK